MDRNVSSIQLFDDSAPYFTDMNTKNKEEKEKRKSTYYLMNK